MTEEQAKALREPFPASAIGKLPKPTKKDNPKGRCPECGKWHGLPAVHLDYVGHAAVTDRLLSVDPEWTWRVLATNEDELPHIVREGLLPGEQVGIWIELTVAGVTRPGFGDGANIKEAISDAIRNAAMRFGVALDLWSKEDLQVGEERKEGGLGNFPVPKSWTKVKEWYEKHGGGEKAVALYEALLRAATVHLYGKESLKEIAKEQRAVMLQKAAGATVFLAEDESQPLGPTPSVELYQKAWAHVLDGFILEVPDAPDLTPDVPDDSDEVERLAKLAEETITGPPA